MYTLEKEIGKYIRVRYGATGKEIMQFYGAPVCGETYDGAIIKLVSPDKYCYALVGDTFCTIAKRFGCDEEELKKLNEGNIYPTRLIILP